MSDKQNKIIETILFILLAVVLLIMAWQNMDVR